MSLIAWYPLNGDIKNYGLGDYDLSAIGGTTGLSSSADGKIGSCYQRTAAAANTYRSASTVNLSGDISMACWAYVSSTPGDSANGLITNHNHSDCSGVGITVKQVSTSDYRISCNTGSGNGVRTYNTYYGTTNIKNAWHHLALTYSKNKKQLLLYVNGNVEYTLNNYINYSANNPIDIFNWSTGFYTSSSYRTLGKLNDVRIYDHCLSLKEVSEISKGLILHYPMSDIYTTSLINKYSGETALGQCASSSMGTGTKIVDNDKTYYHYSFSYTGTGSNKWYNMEFPVFTFTSGKNHKYSCKIRINSQSSGVAWTLRAARLANDYFGCATKQIPSDGKWHEIILTQNITTTFTYNNSTKTSSPRVEFYTGNMSVSGQVYSLDFDITNVQVVESDTDVPYFIDNNLTDNIAYDCSGLGNNSTAINNIIYDSNCAVGAGSYLFNGSNSYIIAPRSAMVKDALTVSVWGYMDDWATYTSSGMRLASCTEGGGWNFEPSSGYVQFAMGTGASENTYKSVKSSVLFSSLSSGWHLFTGTYDGLSTKIYIDGALKGTNSAYSTKTPIFYPSANAIFIGAESGSSATTPAGNYFSGLLNDFRIYATALLAKDVEDLYKNRFTLSNNGTLYCNEYIEQDEGANLLLKYIRAGGQTSKIDDEQIIVGTGVADTYFYLKTGFALTAGTTYTLSCEANNVPEDCKWAFGIRQQSSGLNFTIDKNGQNNCTFVLDQNISANTEFILDDITGRPSTASNIVLSNFRLVEGAIIQAPSFTDTGLLKISSIYEDASSINLYDTTFSNREIIEN